MTEEEADDVTGRVARALGRLTDELVSTGRWKPRP
jgi:hypothetical protein